MPGKNLEKELVAGTYYHVYNRGNNKKLIFKDDEDYRVFLNLLKRYLGTEVAHDNRNREYPNYHGEIEMLSYCLMPNHYHLLFLTKEDPTILTKVMSSATTAYVRHFNKKWNKVGRLFGKQYRAVPITEEAQLLHITRYIHLNSVDLDVDYKKYEYSSVGYYIRKKRSDWLNQDEILEMFDGSSKRYEEFLDEYLDRREELKEIKNELY